MSYKTPNAENEAAQDDSDLHDDEYVMPCAEAILAGTLALMTGHARCGCAAHRDMMGSKAAHNLAQLAQHPVMSEEFRTVAFKLHLQWIEMVQVERLNHDQPDPSQALSPAQAPVQAADAARTRLYHAQMSPAEMSRAEQSRAEQSRALWHTTPEVIQ